MRQMRLGRSGAPLMIAAAVVAVACAAAAAWPVTASADGALAIGRPDDVADHGFAFGMVSNVANASQATDQALDLCRTAKTASGDARKVCQVVQTIHQQCAAVAMDPQKGTPGVGWAIANDKKAAETQALAQCYDTAGTDRRSFCVVSATTCDTGMYRETGN
ncbi:MAG TPA: DUF4189 domain-containing protein [bacterium]|nr:DUF4189 domain-containing protein [bacterium]